MEVRLQSWVIVLPTLNAGKSASALVTALAGQTFGPSRTIVVDSGSDDGSTETFAAAGYQIHRINRTDFDHGGTRNLGVTLADGAEVVMFLTQDALPAGPDCIANLLAAFTDDNVGLAYGRQLPRDQAGFIESHARLFNYPDQPASRAMPGAASAGIKAVFASNSFAAYRTSALRAVGGFPQRTIMGEDQIVAGRMLLAGWRVIYQASAAVKHSHDYSVSEEFHRYFDIGVFHDDEREMMACFGQVKSEGQRFVRSELSYLRQRAPGRIPEALVRSAMKLAGYHLGKRHRRLPRAVSRWLAMNGNFFR